MCVPVCGYEHVSAGTLSGQMPPIPMATGGQELHDFAKGN